LGWSGFYEENGGRQNAETLVDEGMGVPGLGGEEVLQQRGRKA